MSVPFHIIYTECPSKHENPQKCYKINVIICSFFSLILFVHAINFFHTFLYVQSFRLVCGKWGFKNFSHLSEQQQKKLTNNLKMYEKRKNSNNSGKLP
jgi:hypothetical protein